MDMSAELFWKMNTQAETPDAVMGEKHAPKISLDGPAVAGKAVRVRVDVGGGKHPNTNEHFIQWIELRCNGLYIARAEFAPVITDPVVDFTLIPPGGGASIVLSAVSRCNLHGLWESKLEVKVGK